MLAHFNLPFWLLRPMIVWCLKCYVVFVFVLVLPFVCFNYLILFVEANPELRFCFAAWTCWVHDVMLWCRAQLWLPYRLIPCKVLITFLFFPTWWSENLCLCSCDCVMKALKIEAILSLPTEKLFIQIASLTLKMVAVTGIHHMGDELWSWRTECNGTGSGHRLSTLLHMTCMPPTAYMNSVLATTLRFSGEGTKNSHMVCSRSPNNGMLL